MHRQNVRTAIPTIQWPNVLYNASATCIWNIRINTYIYVGPAEIYMLYVLRTLGASNLILALPLTRVAQICIMTASMVYAELQPFKIANSKLTIDFLNLVITFPSSSKKVLSNLK